MANKNFSVKNMYNDLVMRTGVPFNCCTWKAKILILTIDNLAGDSGRGALVAAFVVSKKPDISFLIVLWLD
jgi:hypothetical protein